MRRRREVRIDFGTIAIFVLLGYAVWVMLTADDEVDLLRGGLALLIALFIAERIDVVLAWPSRVWFAATVLALAGVAVVGLIDPFGWVGL